MTSKVLIIDDSLMVRRQVGGTLKNLGYAVIEAVWAIYNRAQVAPPAPEAHRPRRRSDHDPLRRRQRGRQARGDRGGVRCQ